MQYFVTERLDGLCSVDEAVVKDLDEYFEAVKDTLDQKLKSMQSLVESSQDVFCVLWCTPLTSFS